MNKRLAKKAAKWWADNLRYKFLLDDGILNMTKRLEKGFQKYKKNTLTSEQIDMFEISLFEVLMEDENILQINTDYDGDNTLQKAAKRSNVKLGVTSFPWKTQMIIRDNTVSIRMGYGGKRVYL